MTNLYEHRDLRRQSLARPLTPAELGLAEALEALFARGVHDFDAVAEGLQAMALPCPSGAAGPWTADLLHRELAAINAALDAAYAQAGHKRI